MEFGDFGIDPDAGNGIELVVAEDGHDPIEHGKIRAKGEKFFHADGFEAVFFQIDCVDGLLGGADDFLYRRFRAQSRRAESDHSWIIGSAAIDGPSAKSHDDANEAVFTANARRPAIFISRECDAGEGRQKVITDLDADDFLDEDGHLLNVVDEVVFAAIEDGVGGKDAGVDFADGTEQGLQSLFDGALVGKEIAGVFAAKSRAETVFQQTARTNDQWVVAEFVEDAAKVLLDLAGESTIAKHAAEHGIFAVEIVDLFVLLGLVFIETVEADKVFHHVGAKVIGFGNCEGEVCFVGVFGLFEDVIGEEHAAGFSADAAHAVVVAQHAAGEIAEIADLQIILGDVDEFVLIADQVANESNAGAFGFGGVELAFGEGEIAKSLYFVGQVTKGLVGEIGDFFEAGDFLAFEGDIDHVIYVDRGKMGGGVFAGDAFYGLPFGGVPAIAFGLVDVVDDGSRGAADFGAGFVVDTIDGGQTSAVELHHQFAVNAFGECGAEE